jgi:hypothetical protein
MEFPETENIFPGYYTETARIAISNNSKHNISIIDFSAFIIMNNENYNYNGLIKFSNLEFPLNIPTLIQFYVMPI